MSLSKQQGDKAYTFFEEVGSIPWEKLQERVETEQKKIDKADELTKKLESYRFGMLDFRWWKTRKELSRVVKSFLWGHY